MIDANRCFCISSVLTIQELSNKVLLIVFSDSNEDVDFIFAVIKWYGTEGLIV